MKFDSIEDAVQDLKQGRIVIVVDDEDRENEGDFVALADKATPEIINFMITHGRGLVCTPITEERAMELELPLMVHHNTETHETAFTVSVDGKESTTGISAHERAATVQALLRPDTSPRDFRRPGHIFPLIAKKGGVLRRAGHTEAAVDLARLCGAYPAAVICEVIKEDGTMARVPDLMETAREFDLKIITIQDLIHYRSRTERLVEQVVSTKLPTEYGDFRVVGYRNDVDDKEHIALVKGEITPDKPVVVRVHSECLTGDVFASRRCDCGPQLDAALKRIQQEGTGILLYMRQEGRGIGLLNKLKAYKLQDEGLDTVEANKELGFLPDLREYGIGAQILKDLGVGKMRLLTNNPRKITGLKGYGLEVIQVLPLQLPSVPENEYYLKTKQIKLGHHLHI
ncbi:bifunctional 3,4-dihydroxy-2-butanone-4-phosphate synthase/GTP cyclohydrolase II [Kroppenstedtia pulmonis]|uniref:Riboflavin biosynthesis protein RibBA n=1 Tax=Kroppenstedtia pulmonis TaxID=1380685 RepID=A0A7D4BH69_9BACL|nr:bifunctional 3,4-dihydroxy-2-butanone-4-phosphate synthase/GTP cyclohydrolase II [Kroppenstedtia pulmonis]QKG84275.1 bifunctional 3,4-dihydroxy-2-butanone-4-phosphate synthase/GTP cyclohydrolase II [Kroppenstedtia pulmonis]